MKTPEIYEATLEEVEEINELGFDTRVILFNDEIHSFDEVINQIIKAINCNFEKATQITTEAHKNGKAEVYCGELAESIRISSVLNEIFLKTQIEC